MSLETCPCPHCAKHREMSNVAPIVVGFDLAHGYDTTVFYTIRDDGIHVEEVHQTATPEPATDAPQTVTLEGIESKIVREDYIQALNGGTLTICVLTLANGFDVIGTSGCADPAKFDADLGKKYAREDAINKIWPLEGYLLRERMWERGDFEQPVRAVADPIEAARVTLTNAILHGSDAEVDQAGDAIGDLARWLDERSGPGDERQRELAEGIAAERKRAGVAEA